MGMETMRMTMVCTCERVQTSIEQGSKRHPTTCKHHKVLSDRQAGSFLPKNSAGRESERKGRSSERQKNRAKRYIRAAYVDGLLQKQEAAEGPSKSRSSETLNLALELDGIRTLRKVKPSSEELGDFRGVERTGAKGCIRFACTESFVRRQRWLSLSLSEGGRS